MRAVLQVTAVLLASLLGMPAWGVDLHAYTEELPPLNYQAGDRVGGFASELLALLAKEAGLTVSMTVQPWARAYRTVRDTPDSLVYSITRTPERESQFLWLGPISPRRIQMYRLSSRYDIHIGSERDLLQYRSSVMFESAAAKKLAALGLQPERGLEISSGDDVSLKKLLLGRADLVAMLDWSMSWQLQQQGLSQQLVTPVWLLDGEHQYWFALNRQTSPAKLQKLQAALERITTDGRLRQLRRRYLTD